MVRLVFNTPHILRNTDFLISGQETQGHTDHPQCLVRFQRWRWKMTGQLNETHQILVTIIP